MKLLMMSEMEKNIIGGRYGLLYIVKLRPNISLFFISKRGKSVVDTQPPLVAIRILLRVNVFFWMLY